MAHFLRNWQVFFLILSPMYGANLHFANVENNGDLLSPMYGANGFTFSLSVLHTLLSPMYGANKPLTPFTHGLAF